MYFLLFKTFVRSRIALIGLLIIMITGTVSIWIGHQHLQKMQASIVQTDAFQQESMHRHVTFFGKEMGLLLYYLKFSLVNQPHPLNGVAIGQRDIHPSIQSVTIRNLENQQYDTDLFNPLNLLTGHLDLSFVVIFLFPLLIISFSYNLLSEEKEDGTWRLLTSQSTAPVKVLLQKLSVRVVVVMAALMVLYLLAMQVLRIPLDVRFAASLMLAILYLLFWFALCCYIIARQKDSSTNAVLLLSSWLLLTIIIPGAANNLITHYYPVPEALATTVDQRESYHEKWDMDKQATMEKFYAHYPQLRQYTLPDKEFSWLWYYAMQQMGDDEVQQQVQQLRTKLAQRERAGAMLAYFVPTLHAQYQLNELAGSGLSNHLHFTDSTRSFHEQLRLHFYPAIFEERQASAINWSSFKATYYAEQPVVHWAGMMLPLLMMIALLMALSQWHWKKGVD